MSANSNIEWTDHTYNPWRGCTKVSPGCLNCYAETLGHRFGEPWGKGAPRVRASAATLREPIRWNSKTFGQRQRVFCLSRGDWLDPEVPIEWLAELLDTIRSTPNLDWLLLTKRIELCEQRVNAAIKLIPDVNGELWTLAGLAPHNVWIGVSAEDQKRWDERVPILLSIPAAKRFVSVEPMFGPIDMTIRRNWLAQDTDEPNLHWIIFGGESGPRARACNADWIRDGVRQCKAAGVAAFVKQLGSFCVYEEGSHRKRWILDDRKGGDPSEWTEDLRVREWPKL